MIKLLRGLKYTRRFHSKHHQVYDEESRIVCLCLGRRWGKTYTAGLLFLKRFLRRLRRRALDVQAGRAKPWSGRALKRAEARRCVEGVVQGVVVSPARKQLNEIRGNIESRLRASGAHVLLHPDPRLAFCERPPETWFRVGRAAGVIRYFVGSRVAQLVGSQTAILWLNECASLDDDTWRAVRPLLWEEKADVIAEGTPAFDEGHWFTQLAVSGLPDGHERADRKIAPHNPEVATYLGSSTEAYSENVRAESKRDLERSGPEDLYARWQIEGDWRLPGQYVFRWQADRHSCAVLETDRRWRFRVGPGVEFDVVDQPELIGGIDWFRGSAPAGAIVLAVWRQHPLDDAETRPLVVAVDEASTVKGETYSDDAYVQKLVALQERWSVDRWYQDPFSPRLTRLAKQQGLVIKDTDASEKLGRLALLGRLMNCSDELEPCLYVSTRSKTFADQLARYRWARKQDGTPTGKPVQYNDWLIDAAAYVMPHVLGGGVAGGGMG